MQPAALVAQPQRHWAGQDTRSSLPASIWRQVKRWSIRLESQGIKVHFYACDATNEEQVNETFAKIGEEFGSLDLLVNNVGGLGGRAACVRDGDRLYAEGHGSEL